jgi:hypothetical protein
MSYLLRASRALHITGLDLCARRNYGQEIFGGSRESRASKVKMAWDHGGADFQSRFDKTTAQAEQIKEGALRVL